MFAYSTARQVPSRVRGFLPPREVGLILALLILAAHEVPACFGGEPPAPDGPWQRPPALPPPVGNVVQVGTEPELQQALQGLRSGTTILIAPGTYELTRTVRINGVHNVALRG